MTRRSMQVARSRADTALTQLVDVGISQEQYLALIRRFAQLLPPVLDRVAASVKI